MPAPPTWVPMADLEAQYRPIRSEIEVAVAPVVTSQRFVLGPVVEACEASVAAYAGCDFGIGVSSGTDALLVALMAEGIGAGDEVITTSFSFFATAGAIVRLGATPVFADIDPETFNINAHAVELLVTGRTRAIVPVHLYGQMADMRAILETARRHDLVVVEDAAQALGGSRDGVRAGSVGHYGCFSFYPTKNLGGFGDGGMVVTSDHDRAGRVRELRAHGEGAGYIHRVVGGNFRLDALQAAVVSAKLPHLDDWNRARRRNASLYGELLGDFANRHPDLVELPVNRAERHTFHQYVAKVARRDEVRAELAQAGVETGVYYPVPLHLQECFRSLGHNRGDFPAAESAAECVLALPVHPELSHEQVVHVADTLLGALSRQARTR